MKKITKKIQLTIIVLIVFGLSVSYAQESKSDTIHLKTEKIIGNESIVWDTIIIVTADNEDAVNSYLKKKHKGIHISADHKGGAKIKAKSISGEAKKIKMHITADVDHDQESNTYIYRVKSKNSLKGQKGIKVLKKKLHEIDEDGNIEITIESSDDHDVIWVSDSGNIHEEHNVWMSKPHKSGHKMVVIGEKGGSFNVKELTDTLENVVVEYVYKGDKGNSKLKDYSFGFVSKDGNSFTIDSLHGDMKIIKELKIISEDNPNIFVIKDGNKAKEFKFKVDGDLSEVNEDVVVMTELGHMKKRIFLSDGEELYSELKHDMEVDAEDLKKIGIKEGKEPLIVEDFWLFFNKEDVLNLKFTLNTAGKATIKVYESNGKAVFVDKVKYFPGTYDKKISLKEATQMPLYISIAQGKASVVKKLYVK